MANPNTVAALVAVVALVMFGIQSSIHRIHEGHVGVYWRGGALINRVTEPGFHFKMPLIDQFENVQVTLQTDKVTDIPCGTSGGVLIWIDKVEVVNRLRKAFVYETIKNYTSEYDKVWIFDKIHHEINQFCSKHTLQEVYIDLFHTVDDRLVQSLQDDADKWAPGIEIIAIRITKPRIPAQILKNYESMEAEKTKLLIAHETQRVVQKEAETDRMKATIEANKMAEVAKIQMDQQIMEKHSYHTMKKIEDETLLGHQKALADAHYYTITKEAEANQKMLTPEYLRLRSIMSITNNTKIYFGPSMQNMLLDFFNDMVKATTTPTTTNPNKVF